MKEAAGEANLTVVAIILIGVIAAVVTPIITNMMNTTQKRTCCMNAGGSWEGNDCAGAALNQSAYQSCLSESQVNR